MENLSLVIVTDDDEYGRALGQALMQLCSGMMIQIFRKEDFFSQRHEYEINQEYKLHHVHESYNKYEGVSGCGDLSGYESGAGEKIFLGTADLILWDGHEAEVACGGRIILLTEKPALAAGSRTEQKFCIYKYSKAQSITAAIYNIYSEITGHRTVNVKRQQVRLLAFSSCAGGSGCTVAAMAAAQELCRFRGKKVLYLSFEETESTGDFIETSSGMKGISVYLYHLFKSKDSGIHTHGREKIYYPPVESYIIHDDFGVEAFAPAAGRNPLRELSEEEMEIFIASLIDSGRYDVIVADVGTGLSCTDTACLEIAEKICFVTRSGGSAKREEQYLQHLIFSCGENVMDRVIKVENMADENRPEHAGSKGSMTMIETNMYLSRSSTFLQGGETNRIFLDGRFGQEIRTLTESLLKAE